MQEKISFERKKAVYLTVEFDGSIEEYAMAWLVLTNNARDRKNMIWKISNDAGNVVHIICNPKSVEEVKNFCTGIVSFYHEEENKMHQVGKVIGQQDVEVGVPIYEWESSYSCDDPRWDDEFDASLHLWIDAVTC